MFKNIRFFQFVFLVVLVIIIIQLFNYSDINITNFRRPDLSDVAFLVISSIGMGFCSALMWKFVSYFVTGKKSNLSLAVINTGLLLIGKYIPGKIWGIAARTIINKKAKLTTEETIVTSLIEFLCSCAFSIFIGFGLYAVIKNGLGMLVAVLILIAGCIFFIISIKLNNYFFRFIAKYISRIKNITSPEITIKQAVVMLITLFAYWAFFDIGLYDLQLLVGIDSGSKINLYILSAYLFSVTVGFVAVFAPGGIGIREATFTGLCVGVSDFENIVELAIYIRLWLTLFEIVLGLSSILFLNNLKTTK